ncbi:MAG: HAD family hydrolase, partial [Treponema sp.]|nr:HAD family hydrolase [Treponema sp.]
MSELHIIWDLDGTLIDSEEEVMEALVRAVRSAGLSEKVQSAPFRVGPTIDRMLDAALSPEVLTAQKKKEIITAFRNEYDNCGFCNTRPFPGIEEILAGRNIVHHIVTNKPDLATGRILEKLGWKLFFLSVVTPYSFMTSPDDKK